MNCSKYTKLRDFINTSKVLSTLVAVLYIFYWFLSLVKFPLIKYLAFILNPPVALIKNFITLDITYKNNPIGMVPLIVAVVFYILYFVFNYFTGVVDDMEKQHELNVIAERKLEEKLVNENLKEIFKNKTMQYTKFAILLNLELKPMVDPSVAGENYKFGELAAEEYAKIVSVMRKKYVACKAVTPGKLFIVYNNFTLFDDFFTDILKEVKEFSAKNAERHITTNFTFVIDAIRESDKVVQTLDVLEKISTFGYVNKAVATSSFNVRYKLNGKNKYVLETMGISRFFEQNPDSVQKSIDFELFCLKTPKHKQV